MGYGQILEYAMEDDALSDGQELLAEEETMNYIQPEEVVPGAEYIDTFYTTRGESSLYPGDQPQPSGEKALLLPICDWDDGPAPTGDSTETARDAILAVLEGEADLYGVSGDHYNGDTGPMTWEPSPLPMHSLLRGLRARRAMANFNWPRSDEVHLYNDFTPYSFFFREFAGGRACLCGGLILHGQEDMNKAYYGLHT